MILRAGSAEPNGDRFARSIVTEPAPISPMKSEYDMDKNLLQWT